MTNLPPTYIALAFAIIGCLVMLVLWEFLALVEDISPKKGASLKPFFYWMFGGVWAGTAFVCAYYLIIAPITFQMDNAIPELTIH